MPDGTAGLASERNLSVVPARRDLPGWVVVRSHPNCEHIASRNLRHQGFPVYLPQLAVRVRRVIVQRPLFPTYLFVQHNEPGFWRPLRETPGVLTVLKLGHRLQFVRPDDIESLQASEEARRAAPAKPPWAPGMACTLNGHGPFRGQSGVLMHINSTTAVITLLMLGELRRISVPIEHLAQREAD